jgi:hypothetical protein
MELHTAVSSPGTVCPRSKRQAQGTSAAETEVSVSPGSACAAAHSELLRLGISALSRAAGPAAAGKTAATGPSAPRTTAADADGAAAKHSAQAAMTALVTVLEACAGGGARLLADPAASAFYWTLTRALRLLTPEVIVTLLYLHHLIPAIVWTAALTLQGFTRTAAARDAVLLSLTLPCRRGVSHAAGLAGTAHCASGHLSAEVPALRGAAAAPVSQQSRQRPTFWHPSVQTGSHTTSAPGWPGAWRLSAPAAARIWL